MTRQGGEIDLKISGIFGAAGEGALHALARNPDDRRALGQLWTIVTDMKSTEGGQLKVTAVRLPVKM
jgi:hypothetical protein